MEHKPSFRTTPPIINDGGYFRIVSPAGPINREMLDRGIKAIEKLGFTVSCGPHVYDKIEYLAGNDKDRASDLVDALTDPKVDGVICSRGGYGSGRLLSKIPWEELKHIPPKPFLGFSDIGALMLNLWAKSGWITYSAPQAAMGFGDNLPTATLEHLLGLIQGREQKLVWKNARKIQLQPVRSGAAAGIIIPCCLSILTSLAGTPWMPDLSGCVVCLEDLNEPPYRVDRMLWQLQQARAFDGVAGVLLGHFLWDDGDISEQVGAVIADLTAKDNFPIWRTIPFGHVDERMTVPVGIPVSVSQNGEFDWSI